MLLQGRFQNMLITARTQISFPRILHTSSHTLIIYKAAALYIIMVEYNNDVDPLRSGHYHLQTYR